MWTRDCIVKLTSAGARFVLQQGCADVAYARNEALSGACALIDAQPLDFDTVLMLDDDMTFTLADAQHLVDSARETGIAASGMYCASAEHLAAFRWGTRVDGQGRELWQVGLGFIAIPVNALLQMRAESTPLRVYKKAPCWAFTWCGAELVESPRPDAWEWVAEDFRLCRRLGGVHLLAVGVGHIKPIELLVSEETLEHVRRGDPLPVRPTP